MFSWFDTCTRELWLSLLRSSIPIKPELISRVDGACARQLVNLTHNLSALDSGAQRSLVIYKFTSMKTTPEVLRDELSDREFEKRLFILLILHNEWREVDNTSSVRLQ